MLGLEEPDQGGSILLSGSREAALGTPAGRTVKLVSKGLGSTE